MSISSKTIQFSDKDFAALSNNMDSETTRKLEQMRNKISTFCHTTGFTPTQLSGIFYRNGANAPANISEFISDAANLDNLQTMQDLGFTVPETASLLHKAGSKAVGMLAALTSPEGQKQVETLKNNGFTPKQLSYLFMRTGEKTASILATLASEDGLAKIGDLRALTFPDAGGQSRCFSDHNIYTMLYKNANDPLVRLDILHKNRDKMPLIVAKTRSSEASASPGTTLAI